MTRVYYTVGNQRTTSYEMAKALQLANHNAPIVRHYEAIPEKHYEGQANDKLYEKRMKAYGFRK